MIRQCADQIAEAMRQEFITDPQGRRVRAKHAATYTEQGHLALKWDDMRTAAHRHMEMAFAHRRQQIVGDCRQLKVDIDSYNENFRSNRGKVLVLGHRTPAGNQQRPTGTIQLHVTRQETNDTPENLVSAARDKHFCTRPPVARVGIRLVG